MKRSEMFLALYNEFGHKLNSIGLVNEILTFLEKQGMQPPKVEKWEEISGTFLGEGFKVMKMINEWEPEKEDEK